jgi:hypothetical protein
MDETPAANPYAVSAAELEGSTRVPVAAQIASVDPDRGASLTSSAEWPDMRWFLAGDGAGSSFGAGLAMGDGDGGD